MFTAPAAHVMCPSNTAVCCVGDQSATSTFIFTLSDVSYSLVLTPRTTLVCLTTKLALEGSTSSAILI